MGSTFSGFFRVEFHRGSTSFVADTITISLKTRGATFAPAGFVVKYIAYIYVAVRREQLVRDWSSLVYIDILFQGQTSDRNDEDIISSRLAM